MTDTIDIQDILTFEGLLRKTKNFFPDYNTRQGTISNSKFHAAGYACVEVHKFGNDLWPMHKWCQQHCGDNWVWSQLGSTHYFFVHKEDALAFKLKWG